MGRNVKQQQNKKWLIREIWKPVADVLTKSLNAISSTSDLSCVHFADTHVRLTGYNLTHAGRVEVLSNGFWGRVTDGWSNQWRKQEAAVVCRQLGFAGVITALNYLPSGSVPIVMSRVQCVGTEKSLQQCRYNDIVNNYLYSSRDVGVVCKPHRFYPVDYYSKQFKTQRPLICASGIKLVNSNNNADNNNFYDVDHCSFDVCCNFS